MDVVNMDEGQYEQRHSLPGSSADSDASSSTFESNDSSELISDNEKQSDDEDDLREDLKKNIPDCYKSDLNFTSQTSSDITNYGEFQATALCQFMDILNDLDEVLDKSLLARLDEGTKSFDSDEEDLICKIKECIDDKGSVCSGSSVDDDTQVICSNGNTRSDTQETQTRITSLGRSKSFSEILSRHTKSITPPLDRACTIEDTLRNSMRHLDPIVLPALTAEQSTCESLTLPVILFLEHHVNMRPTSAPIQLQVTANISSEGASRPLIVGRRALLTNRTLSLPSPGESEITNMDWNGRNTSRSIARSTSSSSSSDSLVATPVNPNTFHATEERNEEVEDPPFGIWPNHMSAMLACLSCTIGIFNISRFAIFSISFGACFIVQFLILSLVIGIPLFTMHLCLGQTLSSGPVDMWRISPIFKGVGVALLISQIMIGLYSIIGLSWVFVYFRDSFITADDRYKWALPHEFNSEDIMTKNITVNIQETIPQYFHTEVLQRNSVSNNSFGTIKFQVAFNLAVVWMIVFVSLSKGLRSYGKALYMLIFLPLCGILVLCIKILTLLPYDSMTNIFSETEWSEFFINSNSWAAAAQETFLTWGLLGACVMQLTSHKDAKDKNSITLQKESAIVVSLTFSILLLTSFLANTCAIILKNNGYILMSSSFETVKSSQFLWPVTEPHPGNTIVTPVRYMGHYGSIVGVTVWRSGNVAKTFSGWQPLQFVTQLVPATLAVLPHNMMSPAWVAIFFFILIMFGVAQQLAVWHCVVSGVLAFRPRALRVWETSITFCSCVCGLAAGLLLSTDAGIRVVHAIDYIVAGAWWQGALQVALCVGVFAVRGRPLSADALVRTLLPRRSAVPVALSFCWTVLLPVLLAALCIMDFRVGQQRQLYNWRKVTGYWPIWVRQVAVTVQQGVLFLVPMTAFIQTWRYLSKGPPDLFERIQNLYRPHMSDMGTVSARRVAASDSAAPGARAPPDPPPKYTPPPSYSTATGARLLHTLTRSFRTLRRITSSRVESPDDTSQIPITLSESVERQPEIRPPEYNNLTPTIVVEDTDRPTSSRHSLFTREYLRRSFVRKSDSVKNIRSSLRRSFKYGGGLTTSNVHLVRDAEPISNTVAMSAMLEDSVPHTRSLASVI